MRNRSALHAWAGLALLAMVTFLPATVEAQRSGVEGGLFGGPNRNLLVGGGSTHSRIHPQVGVFLVAPITRSFAIRPELVLSRKGFEYSEGSTSCPAGWLCAAPDHLLVVAPEVVRPAFTWLELPVLAAVRLPEISGSGLRPQLVAGPFVALRVGGVQCDRYAPPGAPDIAANSVDGLIRSSCSGDYEPDGGRVARNGDAGFVLGAVLRRGAVGVGLRWTRSLVAALEESAFAPATLSGGRHSTLALTVELTRPLGR